MHTSTDMPIRHASALLALALTASLAACGAAPPRWYAGDATQWTLDLVDPATPEPLVAATVHGRGPYVFLLAPEVPRSFIDRGIAERLGLYSDSLIGQRYVRVANQHDVTVPRRTYEVLALDTGDLHIRNVEMIDAPAGTLHAGGRTIAGILGADLLSRTIVITIDRDAGKVRLALTGRARPAAGAVALSGFVYLDTLYVPARIDGHELTLEVRLGAANSTLRESALRACGLRPFSGTAEVTDETGTGVTLEPGGVGALALDGLAADHVHFYRHIDARDTIDVHIDGTLGQDVLSRFVTTFDRDHETLYLAPRRTAALASRR